MSRNLDVSATPLESDLVDILIEFLAQSGYRVRSEVPNMGQSADIVATRNRWVTFIEAKMKDWPRAMEQCKAHENVADYICLAVAMKQASPKLSEELERSGYGLILCNVHNGTCEWSVKPKRNRSLWMPQRRRLSSMMREIAYEC